MSLKRKALSGAAAGLLALTAAPVSAQSLVDTLSLAYTNNPTLNVQRSRTRSTDEGVAIALSGYRPRVSLDASAFSSTTTARRTVTITTPTGPVTQNVTSTTTVRPRNIELSLVQPLFTGFQVPNQVKQSEAAVRAQREATRNTEQDVLLDAATAFMDVIRDTALVGLQETNVKFLTEQVRAARDRFNVGEGTRTDVAQAEARLQLAISQVNSARAQVNASRAVYRQVVGVEPKKLTGSLPIEKFIPKAIGAAIDVAQNKHPAILAGLHNVDVASFNVKVAEGELLPQANLQASVSRSVTPQTGTLWANNAQIGVSVTVPLYQGGAEYARIRQAKEDLGTARIQLDVTRDQVRQAAVASFGQYEATGASVVAAKAQVDAARLALNGVIEEQRVGQRTTLDVLNAQAELIDAQVNQVTAERNRVVAAFTLVSALGRLDSDTLGLRAKRYDPVEHYDAVRDKWFGLRTPDGR